MAWSARWVMRAAVKSKAFFDPGVIFKAVHGRFGFTAARITHRANQAIARGDFEFVGIEQVDSLQTDFSGVGTKLVERNFLITPARNRLPDIAFAFDRGRSLRPRGRGERGQSGARENTLEHVAAG